MKVENTNQEGATVDELRVAVETPLSPEEEGLYSEEDEHAKELVAFNKKLDIPLAKKMIQAGIGEGDVKKLTDESIHTHIRVKFICDRLLNLRSKEFAQMLGRKNSNSIYKIIEKLEKKFESLGFSYNLIKSGTKELSIEEIDQGLSQFDS